MTRIKRLWKSAYVGRNKFRIGDQADVFYQRKGIAMRQRMLPTCQTHFSVSEWLVLVQDPKNISNVRAQFLTAFFAFRHFLAEPLGWI